jgi:FkbM family methyltransferase
MTVLSYVCDPGRLIRKLQWSRLRKSRPAVDLTSDTWNGRLTFTSGDELIGKFLYVRRNYERHYVTRVIEFLDAAGLRSPSRDVMVDVGANIGMIAIALLRHGWYRRAIAIEPASRNFAYLEHNVQQNGFADQIACRRIALSSSPGQFDMVLTDGNSGGNFLHGPVSGRDERWIEVVTSDTCDALLDREFATLADRIGLIWLDIEGHEGHFLAGAAATLARGVPVVSEFYPVAIERSGTAPADYQEQVRRHFTHVCTLESGGRFGEYPIDHVATLFKRYPRDGTNVIYLKR